MKHVVLNAKYHEKEAEIVAQAGRMNQVTIATNMAGRGTDILLGGNAEFMARQEMVKKGIAQQLRTAGGEVVLEQDTSENIVFYYNGRNTSVRPINGTKRLTSTKKKLTRSTKKL